MGLRLEGFQVENIIYISFDEFWMMNMEILLSHYLLKEVDEYSFVNFANLG